MSQVLIVGVDTIVGANFAASLAEHDRVFGLCATQQLSILGCETERCDEDDSSAAKSWIARIKPEWVIFCSPASQAIANGSHGVDLPESLIDVAGDWASAAGRKGIPFTAISSDAVFTGPWIFHEEESTSFCDSHNANIIRRMEVAIRTAHADSLIVRTHAIGWSPAGVNGALESMHAALQQRAKLDVDCIRHATPILATDLAEIATRAFQANLSGTYHIAGAERVNPFQVAERLADEFDFSPPQQVESRLLSERPTGFGSGETSLQTLKIRRALGVPMPLLADGIRRLHQQHLTGFADRFRVIASPTLSRREEFVA